MSPSGLMQFLLGFGLRAGLQKTSNCHLDGHIWLEFGEKTPLVIPYLVSVYNPLKRTECTLESTPGPKFCPRELSRQAAALKSIRGGWSWELKVSSKKERRIKKQKIFEL
ncbi:hypothetical protein EDD15DRAFT_2516065 [Pisolithus albus]|nr:hypothetical protein EDD15DRAFT_2516065 [Pisolithus albus]